MIVWTVHYSYERATFRAIRKAQFENVYSPNGDQTDNLQRMEGEDQWFEASNVIENYFSFHNAWSQSYAISTIQKVSILS